MIEEPGGGLIDRKHRWSLLIFAIIFLVIVFSRTFTNILIDLLWFDSLDYRSVYVTILSSQIGAFAVSFLGGFIITFLNVFFFLRVTGSRFSKLFSLGLAVVIGLLMGISIYPSWETILKFLNGQPFGISDPQFGRDIGFFVFNLPFYDLILAYLRAIIFFNVIAIVMAAFLFKRLHFQTDLGEEFAEDPFHAFSQRIVDLNVGRGDNRRFLSFIGFWASLWVASSFISYRLASFKLVYSQVGAVYGAGATDVVARIPAYNILAFFALIFAVLLWIYIRKRVIVAIGLFVGFYFLSLIFTGAWPALYQSLRVNPNEIVMETPYLKRNIAYTNQAYGLGRVREAEYPVGELSTESLERNKDILENIRLLDYRALENTYIQQQGIRPYYQFPSVDVDRYQIDGKLVQVMLSARELKQDDIPNEAKSFNNLVFKYTHGFGVAMSPVNTVTGNGLPEYFIKDIPPMSKSKDVAIAQPRIYFGELTNENVIVNTKLEEFDYPLGDKNVTYVYQGVKGIKMTFLNKVLFAYKDWALRYLLSSAITGESQMLMRRNILERVKTLAPFIYFDQDPYLVIGDDEKLYYLVDGYTTTDRYPYSEAVSNFNYLRNSVKAVIDCYSGEVNFYIFEPDDPLIKTYRKIYSELFRSREEFPKELAGHIRYPQTLFEWQSRILSTYHMKDPVVFFNKEDKWDIPQELYWNQPQIIEPYYTLLRLPGEEKSEFIIMRPYTPSKKQNMVAWLAGRSDGEHYGELLLYKFPKGERVPGPMQVEASIDQDPVISQNLTLWGQGGSTVIRGNILFYPIEGSVLGVESLFIQSANTKFPQLKQVILSYKDEVVMKSTLKEALEAIITIEEGKVPPSEQAETDEKKKTGATEQELVRKVIETYKKAQKFAAQNAWEEYGRMQDELSRLIRELEKRSESL